LKVTKNPEGYPMIERPWGYACFDGERVWIPAVFGDLKVALAEAYSVWKCERIVFSSVLNPDEFKSHVTHVVKEWREWFKELGEYVPCIEVRYIPP